MREGQHVKAGDELFEIDREPFRIAVDQAQAKLATVRTDFTNLKSDYQIYSQLAEVAQQNAELKKRDVERKKALAESRAGSQVDAETAVSAQLTARLQAQLALQRKDQAFNQLLGDPNLPIEKFPAYMLAAAALEQAQRDLDHTLLRAPIDGMATQVDNIQLGRFVTAGTPVFAVIDDSAPWVDANPKETDITNLQIGQRATVFVDTFPGHDVLRHRRIGEPGHRRAIRDPAAAERQRQLGQGGAARAAPRPARQGSDDRASCAPA